jgi:hypothetical protein
MKSYHKQLYELTQKPNWLHTDHVVLKPEEVMGLLAEYQNLKSANMPQPDKTSHDDKIAVDIVQPSQ